MKNIMGFNENLKNVDLSRPELNYVKVILSKVSFDRHLFEKELKKAIGKLKNHEIEELKHWCYSHYKNPYFMVLNQCFNSGPLNYQ